MFEMLINNPTLMTAGLVASLIALVPWRAFAVAARHAPTEVSGSNHVPAKKPHV